MGLEPAHRVIDVGESGRVRRNGRHAPIQRRHDYAASRQRFINDRVVCAVSSAPGTAVKLDDERKRPLPGGFEQAKQERLVAVAKILNVLNFKFVVC